MLKKMAEAEKDFCNSDDGIKVTFYTDPLCCWSWAMEPAWKRLQAEYGVVLKIHYKMCGLMPSWRRSKDARTSITRPSQKGPEWMLAARIAGVNINSRIWITDPPTSSYPACVAVKAAQCQSIALGDLYLQLLRTAVMVQGRNISKISILLDLAASLDLLVPDFDMDRFKDDLLGGKAETFFREDLRSVKYHHLTQFPTLIVKGDGTPAIVLRGYQTFETLRWAMLIQTKQADTSDRPRADFSFVPGKK